MEIPSVPYGTNGYLFLDTDARDNDQKPHSVAHEISKYLFSLSAGLAMEDARTGVLDSGQKDILK